MAAGEKLHRCHTCSKTFSKYNLLRKHQAVHRTVKSVCEECGLVLSNEHNLFRHMKIHYKQKLYECSLCRAEFYRREQVERHLSSQHKLSRIECQICGKGFGAKYAALEHLKTHGIKMSDKKYNWDDKRLNSQEPSSTVKPAASPAISQKELLECKQCSRVFKDKWKLNRHKKIHIKNKRTGLRAKVQPRRPVFKRSATTTPNKELECEQCGHGFKDNWSLKSHLKIHLNNEAIATETKFSPPDIETTPPAVVEPPSTHTTPEKECGVCGKAFKDSWRLKRHEKIHLKAEAVALETKTHEEDESPTKAVGMNTFLASRASRSITRKNNAVAAATKVIRNRKIVDETPVALESTDSANKSPVVRRFTLVAKTPFESKSTVGGETMEYKSPIVETTTPVTEYKSQILVYKTPIAMNRRPLVAKTATPAVYKSPLLTRTPIANNKRPLVGNTSVLMNKIATPIANKSPLASYKSPLVAKPSVSSTIKTSVANRNKAKMITVVAASNKDNKMAAQMSNNNNNRQQSKAKKVRIDDLRCIHCKKYFSSLSSLQRHMLTHSTNPDAKPFKCQICSLRFSQRTNYIRHLNAVHGNGKDTVFCTKCGLQLSSIASLNRHIANVHEKKNKS